MSVLHRTLDELCAYPQHDKRSSSSTYRRTHRHLIYELDAPCWICGIRRSQGGMLETHHDHFEWAAQNGLDLAKVTADWPEISDRAKLAKWVDSELNMLVLCAVHHRGLHTGVHMISYPLWLLQRYQGDDFEFIKQPTAHTPLFGK
jgi:hypothetical protein